MYVLCKPLYKPFWNKVDINKYILLCDCPRFQPMELGAGRPGRGSVAGGGTVGMRAPPHRCRTHPDGHRDVLLEAQATSLHPWQQARMSAALELTLLIPADRQIIQKKQMVQNESTRKLANS